MSQLFRELETVTETTTSMLDDITDLLHLIPEVAAVQREVNNLIAQLPTGKHAVLMHQATSQTILLCAPLISLLFSLWCSVREQDLCGDSVVIERHLPHSVC